MSQSANPVPQPWEYWTTITGPDGVESRARIGPIQNSLEAGGTVTAMWEQEVTASSPAGDYTYTVYAGHYPLVLAEPATFAFTKVEGTAGEPGSGGPAEPALYDPQPNPFAARTTLRYALPAPTPVHLAVFDALGREVAVLVDREEGAGHHEVILHGSALPSGGYLVRLEAGGAVRVRRITLVR